MVVDGHCHILPPSFAQRRRELMARDATFAALFPSPKARLATTEGLLAAIDEAAVAQAVVMGMGWSDPELAREANDYLAQAVARYPDRLTGFCSVNPAWGEAAVAEVERCAAARLRGIGELHPDTQGFDITDRLLLAPLMDTARRLGLPVLVHASEPVGHQYPGKGRTTPGKLYRFIQNFPHNTIICAHWGGGLPFYALMPEVPQVFQNVYFDTAASPYLYRPEVFSTVVELIGADKVIFGTDYPLISHRQLLAQVQRAGLDPAAREAILGGNMARLLGL
jgi:predicted TIM-barrel fold metal-dependent hydrolase